MKTGAKRRFSQKKPKATSAFSLPAEPIELIIEKLSFGGDGIARKEGLVYFVPLTAPGDRIKARIIEQKTNFARAELLEIIESSPARVPPVCSVYGQCGGCNWQHLSYEEQLHQKHQILRDQFKGLLKEDQIPPLIPSPNPFRYRNRVQLKFDGTSLGFYARQSHQIIDIKDCPITESALTETIPSLKQKLLKGAKPIPKIELLQTLSGGVQTQFENSAYEDLGFSQVNSRQNENLIATVLRWWTEENPRKIYDLYSGAGNFTFPLLQQFPKASFVGVDLSSKSIETAQKRTEALDLSPLKMKFYLSDVEVFLRRASIEDQALILLDPPRAGCTPGIIQALVHQKIKNILYVSCDPSALSRDLKLFLASGKWKIGRIQAFDMFPQTGHVETLVELMPIQH